MKNTVTSANCIQKCIVRRSLAKLNIPNFFLEEFFCITSNIQEFTIVEFLQLRIIRLPFTFHKFNDTFVSQSNIHLFVDQQSKLKFKERLGKVLINNCFHGMIVDEFQDMLVILIYENAQYNNNQHS